MSTEILQIDIDAAQRRAERIRFHATNANEAMQSLQKLVHMAREFEDHVTLGYASWTAYIKDLFGDEPLRLARDVRRELVAELADAGMSSRSIAPIVGVSDRQVRNDMAGGNFFPPEPQPVAALLDRAPDPTETLANLPDTFEIDGMTVTTRGDVLDAAPARTITGLDGKEYKRPEPAAPRRRSLVDDAHKVNTDLFLVIERVRSLTSDDRFNRNKADILAALQPSVDLALEILADLTTTTR